MGIEIPRGSKRKRLGIQTNEGRRTNQQQDTDVVAIFAMDSIRPNGGQAKFFEKRGRIEVTNGSEYRNSTNKFKMGRIEDVAN